jgi:predicted acylesterase/phospholipase RssA
MPEDEHNRGEISCQTNLLALNEAPQQPVAASSTDTISQKKQSSTRVSLRIPPLRLALCGGGTRCIAHVGVFKALQECNSLHCVKEVLGISAGALFSLLFASGYTLQEIERLALEFDFTLLRTIEPDSLFNFPFTFGLDSGNGLDKFLISILSHKGFSPDITFAEFEKKKKTKIAFRCFATDIETLKIRDFSVETTPNTSIRFAVRASMSLPVLYSPVTDPQTGHMLMDGGVLHNLPLVFQKEEEKHHTLAVLFTGAVKPKPKSEFDVLHVFQSVYDAVTIMRNQPYIERYKDQILCVQVNGFSAVTFDETKEQRVHLIQSSYEQTKKFLHIPFNPPKRRFSCA